MNGARLAATQIFHARAFARATGALPPRRAMPRARYPRALELEYLQALRSTVAAVRAEVERIMPVLVGGTPAQATAALEALRTHFAGVPPRLERLAGIATRVVNFQAAELDRQMMAVFGVGAAAVGVSLHAPIPVVLRTDAAQGESERITGWIGENVSLIKDLADKPLRDIEQLVTRAIADGDRNQTLARKIIEKTGLPEDRAKLIARDQIGKLNGRISADRHQRMGLTKFRWRGVLDRRERPEHRAMEGIEYSYAKPPAEGLPGEPIQCRCHDEPVFDDVLSELDRLEREQAEAETQKPQQKAPKLPPADKPRARTSIGLPPRAKPAVAKPAKVAPPAKQPPVVKPPAVVQEVKPPVVAKPPEPRPRPPMLPRAPRPPDDAFTVANRLVDKGGTSTHDNAAYVANSLSKMPLEALQALEAYGARIKSANGFVTDAIPELKGVQPRGWPPGATWDQVPGVWSGHLKVAAIGFTNGKPTENGSGDVVVHEAGHALDDAHGGGSQKDPKFLKAYQEDLKNGGLNSYYTEGGTQTGVGALREGYAESFAVYVSGIRDFSMSNMVRYWEGKYGKR